MKKLLLFATLALGIMFLNSCKDDDNDTIDYDYHAHIMSPDISDKHMNGNIHFHVNFESHTGETIHHINIKVYNKATPSEVIYNKPDEAHLHDMDGYYEYHDDFAITEANGFSAHSDWVVEAKVWGDAAGVGEEIETLEFHVHPE